LYNCAHIAKKSKQAY